MKRVVSGMILSLVVAILLSMFVFPDYAHAETLGDIKARLAKAEKELAEQKADEKNTKDKINSNNQSVEQIKKDITKLQEDIQSLEKQIAALKDQSVKKDSEVKKVINYVQVAQGDNAYLEYAFGAQDFTDFIYRISVSEQVSKYNKNLIKEYNQLVKETEEKQKEMDQKTKDLADKKKKLEEETKKLGNHLTELTDIKMSTEDEIKLQKESIRYLESIGCKDHEDTKTCGRVVPPVNGSDGGGTSNGGGTGDTGIGTLPSDTAFLRPIVTGYVVSEYGYRLNPATGVYELHEALDVTQSGTVPIYPAAAGVVIGTRVRSSCGGNMIFIIHTVNGKKYTTEYAHLRRIDVKVGDVVSQNTQIGIMGGDRNLEYWDKCSTGQHLHFGIATGHYLKDYMSWNTFIANTYDPRKTVNFPWSGGARDYFKDRTTKY
ncbi:MAG: peptidoglycan DD-metalloendopeptidase family protein [Firmicutes bacterium]|nr:peptidoglycan DD-metalloendopeptidase family protein [Bacillota bacterium]